MTYITEHTDLSDHAGHNIVVNSALKTLFLKVELFLFGFLVFYFSGGALGLIIPPDTTGAVLDSPLARQLWYPIYLLVLCLACLRFVSVLRMATFSFLIVFCVMYCGISILWSVDSPITLRRVIALLITTLAGIYMAARFDWKQFVTCVAFVYFMLAIITAILPILDPTNAIDSNIHEGAWTGPWSSKNYMGGAMTKGFIACLAAWAMAPNKLWFWLPAAALCFAMVIMSTSKTALLISLSGALFFVSIYVFRTYLFREIIALRILLGSLCLLVAVGFFVIYGLFAEELLGLIGKDPTFTGRTDIWDTIMRSIRERWTFGYGYGAFWEDPLGPSYAIQQLLEWEVPSAHNGWLEIWLAGGVILIIAFAIQYFITLVFALARLKRGGSEVYWVILSTWAFIAFSMSESSILQRNDLSWVLFVATAAKLFAFERGYTRPTRR